MQRLARKGGNGVSILVIDDDDLMRDSLEKSLTRCGYHVRVAASGEEGLSVLGDEETDVVICDLRLPKMSGIDVAETIVGQGANAPPVVVITAFGSVETAVQAIKKGAFDYITKPFKSDQLQLVVERTLKHRKVLRENQFLRAELEGSPDRFTIVGESTAVQQTLDLVERYAASSATVLIRGESGTGKELVARAIHTRSARHDRPFLCVNCAALSAGLLESELFGHEKGAFTGADRMRQGRFELADGGTILLDEVSEIDPKLQAKLLRVLQERSFERVGSSRTMKVDVRVLATSNRNLESEVQAGRFREDLFFRLNILPLQVPPMRARKEDIPILSSHFLERNRKRQGGPPRSITPEAMSLLTAYSWPGNVRELENVIERAWVLTDSTTLDAESFPGLRDDLSIQVGPVGKDQEASPVYSGCSIVDMERAMIRDALRRHKGHQRRTAAELGIGVRTLRTKIKVWDLRDQDREKTRSECVGVPGGMN